MTDRAPDTTLLLGLVGQFDHIQLVALPDGRWQGSSRRTGSSGYSVSIKSDPLRAFLAVTGFKTAVAIPSDDDGDDWRSLI